MVISDKINQIKEEMDKLNSEISHHHTMFEGIITSFSSAVLNLDTSISELRTTMSTKETEKSSLANEISMLDSRVSSLLAEQEQLQTKISENNAEVQNLQPKVDQQNEQVATIFSQIEVDQSKLSDLQQTLNQKTTERQQAEAETLSYLQQKQSELQTIQSSTKAVIEDNVVWDYLKSKIDNAEIDILATIAASKNISTEDIKASAGSTSAVMITRSLTKLEADDKIVTTPDAKWDLSPSMLHKLGS